MIQTLNVFFFAIRNTHMHINWRSSRDRTGTVVIEILFMYNPPMMFWHTSRALSLDYYMVPVPQSYWLQKEFAVSVREVVQILKLGLHNFGGYSKRRKRQSSISCPPGWGLAPEPTSQDSDEKARCEICGMKTALVLYFDFLTLESSILIS